MVGGGEPPPGGSGRVGPLDEKQAESQASASQPICWRAGPAVTRSNASWKARLSDDYEDRKGATIHPTETLQAVPQPL